MRHLTLLAVVLAVTPFSNIHAQDSPPVAVGTRVRVTAPTLDIDKYDGTLQAFSGDTIVLERQQRERRGPLMVDTLRVALTSLTRLDIHRGTRRNVGKGILWGGIPPGLVLGGLVGAYCAESIDVECNFAGGFATGFAVGFAGGAIIGGVIGAFSKSDRWEEVPLDQIRVSFSPQRDGRFAFGLSLAF